MKIIKILFALSLIFFSTNTSAQQLKIAPSDSIDIEQLPEYIIIAAESTARIIGSIIVFVDNKNSYYEAPLSKLEELLTNKKKLRIQNQTDLLNAMLQLGFEYVDAFNVGQGDMTKIVFRKKPAYRN